MAVKKIGILEPECFSTHALNTLKQLGEVSFLSNDNIHAFLQDKNIIFIRLKYFIDQPLLDSAPSLEYICTPTTGLNHLDLHEVYRRNIKIISLKGEYEFLANVRATPEHIFGLTLALLRNYKKSFLNIQNDYWDRNLYKGYEIFDNRVGIIGMGRIGKILAKYFNCFGAQVFFYDKDLSIKGELATKKLNSIEELILSSNIVILCASYEKDNEKFFKSDYIDLLKDKYFINAARGEIVDEEYLVKKIEENYFMGIALDVITDESKQDNNLKRLLQLTENRNFILTPHIGGATFESMWKTEEHIANKLFGLIVKT